MLLNRCEFALMNMPVRAVIQRHFEAARFLRMGGRVEGGDVLEIGCGAGTGVAIIREVFGARSVDAFDLDQRMIGRAARRSRSNRFSTRLWVGSAAAIPVSGSTYDAVFDFGVLHHIPDWRCALKEVHRVLKPGGRLYAEEVLGAFITHRLVRRFLHHPLEDRFDSAAFVQALRASGFVPLAEASLFKAFAWFVAAKAA